MDPIVLIKQIIFYASYLVFPFFILLAVLWWKQKWRKTVVFFCALSLVFTYARFIEPNLIATKYESLPITSVENSAADKIKIALFSDLHLGIYKSGESFKKLVHKTNAENPDLILIPGDFLYHIDEENMETEFDFLTEFDAPVFAVTGNHDIGAPGPDLQEEMNTILEQKNVFAMDNKSQSITIRDNTIRIIGLSDLWGEDSDYELLKNLPQNEIAIVLAHNPDAIYEFPDEARNIDLVVSGHTHGGQIRIPWLYKKVIPCKHPFDKGWYTINNTNLYVSPGVGMVGLPLRFLMPPQLDIITLEIS